MVQDVASELAEFVVAVNGPYRPADRPAPESTSNDPYRPEPDPIEESRTVTPPGADHAVVEADLSAQYVTAHAPAGTDNGALT